MQHILLLITHRLSSSRAQAQMPSISPEAVTSLRRSTRAKKVCPPSPHIGASGSIMTRSESCLRRTMRRMKGLNPRPRNPEHPSQRAKTRSLLPTALEALLKAPPHHSRPKSQAVQRLVNPRRRQPGRRRKWPLTKITKSMRMKRMARC